MEELARRDRSSNAEWIAFGPWIVFPAERSLKRDGRAVAIGDKALDLLLTLIDAPGEVLSKTDLAARVWRRSFIEDGSLRVAVGGLRKLLGNAPDGGEYVLNVVGRGYSFSSTVSVERWPEPVSELGYRPRRHAGHGAGRLPPLLNRVFGRRRDSKALGELLSARRFVTLVGTGGIGKTTTAIACASLLPGAEDLVRFVDLAPIRDPALVPSRIAASLGVEHIGHDPLEFIDEHLAERRLVLILDNAEHVADAVAFAVEQILVGAPDVNILVTSREPLGATGETVYRLEPLRLPAISYGLTAAEALKFDAVELFVDRIQANAPDFALTDAMAPAAAEICHKLGGVALAIRLAAGRVPAFGVKGIAGLLEDRFRLLSQGQRAAPSRHQTLQATFDWSYDLLSASEKTLLARVAIFSHAFTIHAAQQVATDTANPPEAILATIGDLVAKSLVMFVEDESGPRYRLLETVRGFALARLEAAGEVEDTSRRHARYVVGRCDVYHAEMLKSRDGQAVSIARATLDDARAAIAWSIGQMDWPLASELLRSAGPLLTQLGFAKEVGDWIERLLEVETDPEKGLKLMISLGGALWLASPEDLAAVEVYANAYRLALELRDVPAQLRAAWSLILATCSARRPQQSIQAAQLLAEGTTADTDEDAVESGKLIRALAGVSRHLLGDYASCEASIRWLLANYPTDQRAVDSSAYLYDPRHISRPFLAWIELFSGRLSDAAETSECLIRDVGDHVPSIFTNILRSAFPIAVDCGLWAVARSYIATLERHFVERPSWRVWIDALRDVLATRMEHSVEALWRFDDFVTGGERFNGFGRQTWYYLQLIKCHMALGNHSRAEILLREMLAFVETKEDNWWRPEMMSLQACLRAQKDPGAAYPLYLQAAELARSEGSRLIELRALLSAMRIAQSGARREEARRLSRDTFETLKASSPSASTAQNMRLLRHALFTCARLQRSVVPPGQRALSTSGAS